MRGYGNGEVYYKGKSLPISPEVAHAISLRAAEIVRRTAPVGPNNSRRMIRATWQRGQVGVHIPLQAIHLLYLDRGIRPFVMKELEGKTIPIRTPGGQIVFRRAKNVGSTKILTRDERGAVIHSKVSWRYPGVEPMNFIQPAITMAIREYFQHISSKEMMEQLQDSAGPIGEFFSHFKEA